MDAAADALFVAVTEKPNSYQSYLLCRSTKINHTKFNSYKPL